MALSDDLSDTARSRLATLGAPPLRVSVAPPDPATGVVPAAPSWAESPPDPSTTRADRVGWPPAAPGTPAARLRLSREPVRVGRPGWDGAGDPRPGGSRFDRRGCDPPWDDDPDDDSDDDLDEDLDDDEDPEDRERGTRGAAAGAGVRVRSGEPRSAWDAPTWRSRLAERWLPASWRDARWDPGRVGALALAVVAAGAAVVAAVGVWGSRPAVEPVPALPVVGAAATSGAPSRSAVPGPAVPGAPLVVSVAGKVAHPGLVRVADGARVGDAVAAAGGALPGTDLTALNLAARVADGDQVLVGVAPPPGATAAAPAAAPAAGASASGGATGGASGGAAGAAPGGPLDLNAATLEQLDGLPGVGPATAKKILDYRTQNGRFTSVDQLREISGIGEARFATLRGLVRV